MKSIMTLTEVAEEFGVHRLTVRDWIKKGELNAKKINSRGDYRISEEDLKKYLESVRK